ncbi:MAG: ABC transporter permease [Ilumatobacteraceae bacterium]
MVAALLIVVTALCAVLLDGFLTRANLSSILVSSAVLVVLGVGGAVVIIGGGIDLSAIVIFGICSQVIAEAMRAGHSEVAGLVVCLGVAFVCGLVNGLIVAYGELPALLVTLATALLFRGVAKLTYLEAQSGSLSDAAGITLALGRDSWLGVDAPIVVAAIVVVVMHVALTRSAPGRAVYAMGDNVASARLIGLPIRPMVVATYLVSALLAAFAGVLQIGIAGSYDTRTYTSGTLLYDVLAVIVIGGVSLAGGRGRLFGVVAAALLIGVLRNAMTRADLDTIQQLTLKSLLVLTALVLDARLHPRSVETARPGEL